MTSFSTPVLSGIRILSLALNLPGPAALMRCQQMGAECVKLEPPANSHHSSSGDPMGSYQPNAYEAMHHGVRLVVADLKSAEGQNILHQELSKCQVLITSFRPSALRKLGLDWPTLQQRYPSLNQIAIVGSPGERAEEPGHDLTYMAENDLVTGLNLPPSLYADMAGSLLTTEAILQVLLAQQKQVSAHQVPTGQYKEIALSDAAAYLALPRFWGLTTEGKAVGGGHAGYNVYACLDGRVAIAALEPHFAIRLLQAAGLEAHALSEIMTPSMYQTISHWVSQQSCSQLENIARTLDIPLHTLK